MKILVTGGHLTPALSMIDFIQKEHSQDKLVFVGREFSQDSVQQKAVERYEVEKRGVSFITFQAVRLGSGVWKKPHQLPGKLMTSVQEARKILLKQKPDVLLSFGGYVAVPFAIAAWQLKIPVVTHEQTLISGFANKLISVFAKKVAVTFLETIAPLWARKTVVTGNPLRAGVFLTRHPKPVWLPSTINQPILLVMGGNQGARALNEFLETALPELLPEWLIVHQCGQPTADHNTKEVLDRARRRLPAHLQERYFILEWIDDEDLFWLYRHAEVALSRSGANATQELAAANLPAILVPLPSSRKQEQLLNARWLVQKGGAILIPQANLTLKTFLAALAKLKTFNQTMRDHLAAINLPQDAAEKLYSLLSQVTKAV